MKPSNNWSVARSLVLVFMTALTGCANQHVQPQSFDYTAFNAHKPHSILILPPLNNTTSVNGAQIFYAMSAKAYAERGYYVFPAAIVEAILKENGLPGAEEMHAVAPHKFRDIIGADAVLYTTLQKYVSPPLLESLLTGEIFVVEASAKLVDASTGITLWESAARAAREADDDSSGGPDRLCVRVHKRMLKTPNHELPYGPYHPKFGAVQ